ncbi:MAG TPA: AIR synthase family protein [Armatimonadota bacterium]|jgi:hydrogenase maturation factor
MEIGKLPHNLLAQLLSKIPMDERVVVGPGIGMDAAVLDFGDRLLIAKTDPVTFATDLIGWYAVNVNANDIAAMGGTPKWFLATLLLPNHCSPDLAADIFDQILNSCAELDISLVGGHTEITYDLPRSIVVGCMLGESTRTDLVSAGGARIGDRIIMTKGVAVEGTSLLAREYRAELVMQGVGESTIQACADLLFDPGISVVRDAHICAETGHVTAMHDPTEGGLATGLMEMAVASGLGIEIEREAIPVLAETEEICSVLGLDSMGLIASGTLLVAVSANDCDRVIDALARSGIAASDIGCIQPKDFGLKMRIESGLVDLPAFARDEIARVFEGGEGDEG